MAVRAEAEVDKVKHRWRTGDVQESFAVSGKQTLCLLVILPQLIVLANVFWIWQVSNEVMSLLGVMR